MLPTKLIFFAVLIMIQLDYGLTWVILLNCTNCDILHALLNNSRTNSALTQDNTLSKSMDSVFNAFNYERMVDPDGIERSLAATEETGIALNWTIDSMNSASTGNFTTVRISSSTSAYVLTGTFSKPQSSTTGDATTITTHLSTTSNYFNDTITSSPKSEKNLALILGLTLGLGIPLCLLIISSLVYYFKIYRPRHPVVVISIN